ncbi:MAG: hypothetical protein WKF73_01285 [Nocardioidaceae bacterium]
MRVEHAEETAALLNDPSLHLFIGGEPATVEELRDRYRRWAAGRWVNLQAESRLSAIRRRRTEPRRLDDRSTWRRSSRIS